MLDNPVAEAAKVADRRGGATARALTVTVAAWGPVAVAVVVVVVVVVVVEGELVVVVVVDDVTGVVAVPVSVVDRFVFDEQR